MKFVLVVDRKHLFSGLSPQGHLGPGAVDLQAVERHAFFAEREYMEHCSHFKQLIPYIALTLDRRILCYQRQQKHSERRLGGLWTVGFGGHIEPIDRAAPEVRELGMMETAALRELHEETGLTVQADQLELLGYINSDANDVSSVHFGVFFTVDLGGLGMTHDEVAQCVSEQAEPHRVAWLDRASMRDGGATAPDDGEWENWTLLSLEALAG